jgi:hypothetical protein
MACGSNSLSTTKCSECFPLRISKNPLTTAPESTIYTFTSNKKKRKNKKKLKTLTQNTFKENTRIISLTFKV